MINVAIFYLLEKSRVAPSGALKICSSGSVPAIIAGTEPELKDERLAHPSALSIALGTRFRGRYNKQNIELYGLAQYSACLVALGIKFRGRPTLVKDGGVYTPPSFSHG